MSSVRPKSVVNHGSLLKQKAARSFPFLAAAFDPLLQPLAVDAQDTAVGHHFEHGGGGRNRESGRRVSFHVGEVEMGRVVCIRKRSGTIWSGAIRISR